jgi:hypothetical protein
MPTSDEALRAALEIFFLIWNFTFFLWWNAKRYSITRNIVLYL